MPDKQEFQEILDCGLAKLIEKHGTHGIMESMILHVMTECGLSRSAAIVFLTPSEQLNHAVDRQGRKLFMCPQCKAIDHDDQCGEGFWEKGCDADDNEIFDCPACDYRGVIVPVSIEMLAVLSQEQPHVE